MIGLATFGGLGVKAAGSALGFAKDAKEKAASSDGVSGSTNILGDIADVYAPAMDKLKEKKASTDLVDNATATSDSRFKRGVQAADHMQAATGGATTRQQALAKYKSTMAGAANRDGSINAAREGQNEIREAATGELLQTESNLLGQQLDQARHGENLKQQREIANAQMKAKNKASKRGFWGNVAGTALGIGAAALLT